MGEAGIQSERGRLGRLAPLVALLAIGAAIVVTSGGPGRVLAEVVRNGEALHGWVERWGVAAGLAFVVGYAALMTTMWVPAWVCSIVGGFLFGFWLGAAYSLVGATLGATSLFTLARLGLGGLTRRAAPFVRRLEAGFRRDAFSYLVVLRLVPMVPFAVVNVAPAGLGVPTRTFVLATLLGIVPSTLIYAGLGNALVELGASGETLDGAVAMTRPRVLLPLVGLALLALTPVWYRRVRRA
jgi:uncharacterized membrane protein YdjX (TVP38/TMEM64 family)